MKLALLAAVAISIAGCGTPAGESRTAASARIYRYSDDAGLGVTTLGASAETPLARGVELEGRAIVEQIQIDGENTDTLAHGGHNHAGPSASVTEVDVISSASTTARTGGDTSLFRYEGQLGTRAGVGSPAAPADVGVEARLSSEPDYSSLSAAASGRVDLFERNLVLALSAGVARDRITPDDAPPGGSWPAHHDRVFLGLSLSQVLGPRTVVAFSLTLARQSGTLENPYRRVLVRTTLFPESVPDLRQRFVGSASLAQYLGRGFALHLQNGVYADDWSVLAWIPEGALAWDLSGRALVDLHVRWYAQTRARFYAPVYHHLAPELSADVRLGSVRERSAGASLELPLFRLAGAGELALDAGYDLSLLEYRDLGRDVVGHLVSLGVGIGAR